MLKIYLLGKIFDKNVLSENGSGESSSGKNIFNVNIFGKNIFSKNICFLPFPHLTALQTTPTSSQLLISDF